MDFRIPEPLKYSLKKKKRRWKLLREETKKLSLRNHKRNASCQTDSSESSESVYGSSKKNSPRNVTCCHPTSNRALSNSVYRASSFPEVKNSSVYHYCTPARRKMDKEVKNSGSNHSQLSTALESTTAPSKSHHIHTSVSKEQLPKFGCEKSSSKSYPILQSIGKGGNNSVEECTVIPFTSTDTVNQQKGFHSNINIERGSKYSVKRNLILEDNNKDKKIMNTRNSTILLSDSDSSLSRDLGSRTVSDALDKSDELNKSDVENSSNSIVSQFFLESSLSSGDRVISDVYTAKNSVENISSSRNRGAKTFIRSSVLNKKFNKVVESDMAVSGNASDFYLRVKRRVLGLHNENDSENSPILKTFCGENPEKDNRGGRKDALEVSIVNKEDEKQSQSKFSIESKSSASRTKSKSLFHKNSSENHIMNKENKTQEEKLNHVPVIAEINSPDFISGSDDSLCKDNVILSEKKGKSFSIKSHLSVKKKVTYLKSSDSENSLKSSSKLNDSRKSQEYRKSPNSNVNTVIPDSELSSSSGGVEFRRKRATFVIGSSDSGSSICSKSDDQDDINLINDFHESDLEGMQKSDSGDDSEKEEKQNEVKELKMNSGYNEIFRRVTKRALILESSDSTSIFESQKEIIVDAHFNPKGVENNFNLLYKPGFSTLSQSKHEDIKKWLNTIPCSGKSESRNSTESIFGSRKSLEADSKTIEEDNINLTDMELVLNELYGREWLDGKKFTPKVVAKKKESQIITERLTDSDDSSTPPLPASTPKRRLFNNNIHVLTSTESCLTPAHIKNNDFTPLTSVGKKGPRNVLKTPKTVGSKSKTNRAYIGSDAVSSPVLTFVASLSVTHQSARCHPEAKYFVKSFKGKREELARKLFNIFNKEVFSSELPQDMPLLWNNRLRKTAGYCYNRRVKNSDGTFTRTSRVELSSKIVDNAGRLRDTLIHELCHAATWIISEVTGGHGPTWKRWTNKAMAAFPELPPISRCHNYDIVTKYKYKCVSCNYSIGRHSKSLNVERKVCGICGGKFELFLNRKNDTGKPVSATPRTPNAFALYVKENYGSTKKSQNDLKHKDVMKILSVQFAATKISSDPAVQEDC